MVWAERMKNYHRGELQPAVTRWRAAHWFACIWFYVCSSVWAMGESPQPSFTTECNFSTLVTETDKQGLNVRLVPSQTARVLGQLAPVFLTRDRYCYPVKVVVDVLRSRDGWIEIDNAADNETLTERPAHPMYGGPGWVSGRKLTVKSQAVAGYGAPDVNAKVVLRSAQGWSLDMESMIRSGQLVGCRDRWALVEFDLGKIDIDIAKELEIDPAARAGLPRGRFRAWVNQICGIQETTCDGLGGDESEPTR